MPWMWRCGACGARENSLRKWKASGLLLVHPHDTVGDRDREWLWVSLSFSVDDQRRLAGRPCVSVTDGLPKSPSCTQKLPLPLPLPKFLNRRRRRDDDRERTLSLRPMTVESLSLSLRCRDLISPLHLQGKLQGIPSIEWSSISVAL
jgi:hypothetical protein